jgi:hypothetical protein
MTDATLRAEALAAARGHLRLAERIAAPLSARLRVAERSGRAPTMAEVALAGTLSKELAEATDRVERLKLWRQR